MPGDAVLAFDDFIYGTSAVYSSSFLDGPLAQLESYSIQATVDPFSQNTLTIQLETSPDGRHWIPKNPGVPEISVSFGTGATVSSFGEDVGARPALALVRLRIQLSGSGGVRVRVYVREGPSARFTPLALAPRAWLRADLGIRLDGAGGVSSWRDMTANGFDATQGTSTRRPSLATTSQLVGGQPAVYFDASSSGSEKIMSMAGSLAGFTAGHAFVVFQRSVQPPPSALRAGFWRLGTSGLDTQVPDINGDIQDDTGSTTRRNLGTAPSMTSSAHCFEARSAASAWSAYLNGQSLGSSGTNTVGFSATPDIGGDWNVVSFYDGAIAEIILFDRILVANERGRLVQYLKARYLMPSFP